MKTIFSVLATVVIVCFAGVVHGEERAIVRDRIKVIAPLIDEQTIAVAHLDLTRVSLDPLFDAAGRLELVPPDAIALVKATANSLRQKLIAAGVKNLYAFYSLSGGLARSRPFVAVPLDAGGDPKTISDIIGGPPMERRGGVLLIAPDQETLAHLHGIVPDDRPELAAALDAAGDTAAQILLLPPKHYRRVLEEAVGDLPKEAGGGPISVLTRGMLWAVVGIDPPPHAAVKLTIQSEGAVAAAKLHGKLGDLLRMAQESGALKRFDPNFAAIAPSLIPRVEGDRLQLVLDDKTPGIDAILAAIVRPFQSLERGSARDRSINNLKQIGLAMFNYYDAQKHFPLPGSVDPKGKPLLSWRVAILPYIEQGPLYQQFHLDESWDSPHNRTLIDKMPAIYHPPSSKLNEPGRTNYLLPVGHGAAFSADKPTELTDITDGSSNTIMIVESDDDHAVIWTKPDDWQFDPEHPARGLGRFGDGGCNVAFCDGSVHRLSPTIAAKTLKALFTKAGGEVPEGF